MIWLKICGVTFSDLKQYEIVKRAVDSLLIEGMKPTYERVKVIKDLLDGKLNVEDVKKKLVKVWLQSCYIPDIDLDVAVFY